MFKDLGFIKSLGVLFKIGLIAITLYIAIIIPLKIIYSAGSNLFYNFGKIGNILVSLWYFALAISAIALFVIVMFYIYKTIFLNKYEFNKYPDDETKNDLNEEKITNKKEIKNVKKQEDRNKNNNSSFIELFSKLFNFFIKALLLFILIPGLCSLVMFVFGLTIDIYFLFKGIVYVGVLLGLIALIVINYIIVKSMILFIINKKINYKANLFLFLGSLILGGIAIGVLSLEVVNTRYYNEAPNEKIKNITELVAYEKGMSFDLEECYYCKYTYEYKIDNSLKNVIKVDYKYYEDYNSVSLEFLKSNKGTKNYYFQSLTFDEYIGFNTKFVSLIMENLKNKEVYNYDLLFNTKITITGSSKNIEAMKKTSEQRYSNNENQDLYSNCMNDLYEQESDYQNKLNEKEITISELEENIRELEEKIEFYKDNLESILNE